MPPMTSSTFFPFFFWAQVLVIYELGNSMEKNNNHNSSTELWNKSDNNNKKEKDEMKTNTPFKKFSKKRKEKGNVSHTTNSFHKRKQLNKILPNRGADMEMWHNGYLISFTKMQNSQRLKHPMGNTDGQRKASFQKLTNRQQMNTKVTAVNISNILVCVSLTAMYILAAIIIFFRIRIQWSLFPFPIFKMKSTCSTNFDTNQFLRGVSWGWG